MGKPGYPVRKLLAIMPGAGFLRRTRVFSEVSRRLFPQGAQNSQSSAEYLRKQRLIAGGETDYERWTNGVSLDPAWNGRAQCVARQVEAGSVVLDLGAGDMAIERFLPPECTYIPCDLTRRDSRTIVCDFNRGEFPKLETISVVTALGVLEYIYDARRFLVALAGYRAKILLTYSPTDFTPVPKRIYHGWVNSFSQKELAREAEMAGLRVKSIQQIDQRQVLVSALA